MSDGRSLVFVKLGGSLISDKKVAATPRPAVIRRLATEVSHALQEHAELSLVLGHGSGSFGHVVAQRYHVQSGCSDWRGFALTSAAAARLNRMVADAFLDAGVPVVSIQPSASARCRAGLLIEMAMHPVCAALEHQLVPLVYGDVASDELWGSTIISTEAIFAYLARQLRPQRILLLAEVDGVYSADPRVDGQARLIRVLHAGQMGESAAMLGGSHGVDVTGGMRSKVQSMAELVRELPELQVRVMSGLTEGLLERVLGDAKMEAGTLIVP